MTEKPITPGGALAFIRKNPPLIHNITNYVVMNYTANALLALGASPVMAHAPNEVEEMVGLAGALVLNIGTLEDDWIEAMILAGRAANKRGVPVVLDPVGAGATRLRTEAAGRLLKETRIAVIRGNASEVLALGGAATGARGVDSVDGAESAAEIAAQLATDLKVTLAITGPVDLITRGEGLIRVKNGHPLMGRVTGTGCTATALIGAFLTAIPDTVDATAAALAFWGLCGERAGAAHAAPGSFMIGLLDALYEIQPEELDACASLERS